ncbi:hypothetical protein O4273_23945 [Rhodococcus ruber]|uniref:hypothetical protein n=1 Tax=Rhodococcus ruber TaxID=1830 RepID=UPI0022B3DB29|nr:hypothetical protein [Rhodococcus ruber]MCZ4505886.1 hypothetical protein [Rhodococcus ruber]
MKSARDSGEHGWFAYRSGEFDKTAVLFTNHNDAFCHAEEMAEQDWDFSIPPQGWH